MEEKTLLGIKNALGAVGLLQSGENFVRWLRKGTPAGKQYFEKQRLMRNFYAQFVQAGDLCFDVGANLGNRIEIFLALGAKVIAVEPQESCLRYLRLKYKNPAQVLLIPKGLDEKAGEREMLIADESAVSSMAQGWVNEKEAQGLYRWERKITVQVTTLDTLIDTYGLPKFCKIDVEGFEYQVLKGLSRPVPALSFEYHADVLSPALSCIEWLTHIAAYEFNYSAGETMVLALEQWVSPQEISGILSNLPDNQSTGDVYARLQPT